MFIVFLCLFLHVYMQAADNTDMTPAGFMACLKTAEIDRVEWKNKFTCMSEKIEQDVKELFKIKHFMQKKGYGAYYNYYVKLAHSSKLSDKDKIQKRYLLIPYFNELSKKAEKEKDEALDGYYEAIKDCYSFGRLLLAAFCYAEIDVTSERHLYVPLYLVLSHNDLPLIEVMLASAQEFNLSDSLSYASSLEAETFLKKAAEDLEPKWIKKWKQEYGGKKLLRISLEEE